jgi:hypothetical protein
MLFTLKYVSSMFCSLRILWLILGSYLYVKNPEESYVVFFVSNLGNDNGLLPLGDA